MLSLFTPSFSDLSLSYLSIYNPSLYKPSVSSPWSVWLLKHKELVGFGRACAPVRCAHPSFWAHCHAKRGAVAPPLPAHRSFSVSYLTPKNILSLSNLGRPRQGPFSFHRNTEAMKYEVHLPPASPIAALPILPALFWGQIYVPVPPYALIFLVFLFYSFGSFLFIILFPFFSPFQFLLILLFLSLLILLIGIFFVFLFFSSYTLNCLSYYRHVY